MNNKTKNIVVVCLIGVMFFSISFWCWFKNEDTYSESERRVLASFPELTLESLFNGKFMKDFESYTQDQFPMRDKFRSVQSMAAYYLFGHKENNDIFLADGHVSKIEYPISYDMLDHAAERFEFINEQYLSGTDVNIYFSVVPDKNYFLAEQNGYLSLDYDELVSYMQSKTDYMDYIDVSDTLCLDDYYFTDTHWRQENITDTANRIASEMGVSLSGEYETNTLENPFYGVYCGQAALPLEPDTIRYLTNDAINSCTVTSYDTGSPVAKEMYDMKDAYGKDPYEMFLSGAEALMVIENPNASTDKELVIFRDSFGSSIAPLLAEGYAKVTLIDIRYIQSAQIGNFVDFNNQDVLFLYSTILLNNSLAFK